MIHKISNKLNSLQTLKQTSKTKHWNITWLQGVFLSNLIQITKPNKILEIGTSNGFSTLWLAKNLPQTSTIDTIEINETRYKEAQNTFKLLKLKNITSHLGDAFEIIPTLKQKYDIIFLDAKQEKYSELIKQIEKNNLLTENANIIIDNIISHKMKEFTNSMQQDYFCETIKLGSGMLYAKKLNNPIITPSQPKP